MLCQKVLFFKRLQFILINCTLISFQIYERKKILGVIIKEKIIFIDAKFETRSLYLWYVKFISKFSIDNVIYHLFYSRYAKNNNI